MKVDVVLVVGLKSDDPPTFILALKGLKSVGAGLSNVLSTGAAGVGYGVAAGVGAGYAGGAFTFIPPGAGI